MECTPPPPPPMVPTKKSQPTMAKPNKQPRQLSVRKVTSSRRSLAGSVTSSATHVTKEAEDTFQVMLDLLAPPINYPCSSSSSSSSGKLTPPSNCSSNGSGAPNKRRLSPNSPTNYLQIGHDGQVKTCAFPSSLKSAFMPIQQLAPSSPDAAAGNPLAVFTPPKPHSSPQSPGREPPGFYASHNVATNDVVLEYTCHNSHTLKDAPCRHLQGHSSHSRRLLQRQPRHVSFAAHSIHEDESTGQLPTMSSFWTMAPHAFFLVGCCLYVATAFWRVEFGLKHQNTPTDILHADDDAVLWDYYNRTLAIPVSQEDWLANNRPFLDDDFMGNAAVSISKFQVLAITAAICFLATGLLQVFLARGKWKRATYGVMVVAATLGVASCVMIEYDGSWANALHAASVHLFAVHAISLVVIDSSEDIDDENDNVKGAQHKNRPNHASVVSQSSETAKRSRDKMFWLAVGNILFLLGTLIDVFLSYFRINRSAGIPHAYASVVAAACWLVSSVVSVSMAARHHCSLNADKQGHGNSSISSQGSDEKRNTTLDTGVTEDPTTETWIKAKPLADGMDEDNSIVSGAPGPFDEVRSL